MKRIEDEEVKTKFDEAVAELPVMFDLADMPRLYQHFFQAGRDSLAKEFWTARPKRTISHLIKLDGQIYVISNDGKLFINHYTRPEEWQAFPDLPQD